MKAIYLKPETDVTLLSSEAIMISASGDGTKLVEDGGSTSENSITEADSRHRSIWDDED